MPSNKSPEIGPIFYALCILMGLIALGLIIFLIYADTHPNHWMIHPATIHPDTH